MFPLQTQPNLIMQEQMAHGMGGYTINPAKHCGNGWCIRGKTATNPTKATKAGIDGVPAQPLNLARRHFKGSAGLCDFRLCEILGIDGATNYEKWPEM